MLFLVLNFSDPPEHIFELRYGFSLEVYISYCSVALPYFFYRCSLGNKVAFMSNENHSESRNETLLAKLEVDLVSHDQILIRCKQFLYHCITTPPSLRDPYLK